MITLVCILIAVTFLLLGYFLGRYTDIVDGELIVYKDGSIYPRFYDYKSLKKKKHTKLKIKKSNEV